MPGTQAPSSPATFETRQETEELAISQTLLGIGASVASAIIESAGFDSVRILVRANATSPGTVEVYQAVSNPAGGPVFTLTKSQATAADPSTGEQVAFFSVKSFSGFMRIVYVNGGVVQTAFEMSAYLIPVGG